jgi:hypothetical protein
MHPICYASVFTKLFVCGGSIKTEYVVTLSFPILQKYDYAAIFENIEKVTTVANICCLGRTPGIGFVCVFVKWHGMPHVYEKFITECLICI